MDKNYFRELKMMGNEASSSSSRKGKKKNNQDKPKQSQRGLGVAQLEKLRIHALLPSSYHPSTFNNEDPIVPPPYNYSPILPSSTTPFSPSYGFQSNYVMGLSEYERTNIRYSDSHPTNNTTRWEHGILNTHSSAEPRTGSLLNLYDSRQHIDTKKHTSDSLGSSSQNYESCDPQEPDLELRLSL